MTKQEQKTRELEQNVQEMLPFCKNQERYIE